MRFVRPIAATLAGIGGVCAVLMMLQIVADVLWRWMFGRPISGTMEIVSNYYLVPLTFLPLAMVELADQHIAVNLFVKLLPVQAQRVLAFVTTAIAVVFTVWLAWANLLEAIDSYRMGEVIETAASVMIIWPSRFVVVLGVGFMGLVLVIKLFMRARARLSARSDLDGNSG
jgi:TRAP-type C4-dicarboxylate transport system permease small subunit